MKIELTPTDLDSYPRSKVSIDYPIDDLDMNQILKELIIPALLAAGFQHETIKKYILTDSE